jgi:hypothetical protein
MSACFKSELVFIKRIASKKRAVEARKMMRFEVICQK